MLPAASISIPSDRWEVELKVGEYIGVLWLLLVFILMVVLTLIVIKPHSSAAC